MPPVHPWPLDLKASAPMPPLPTQYAPEGHTRSTHVAPPSLVERSCRSCVDGFQVSAHPLSALAKVTANASPGTASGRQWSPASDVRKATNEGPKKEITPCLASAKSTSGSP